jgi:hypothetical protein
MRRKKRKKRERVSLDDTDVLNTRTILTEKLIEEFCAFVEDGKNPSAVAGFLGIDPSVYWTWIDKGRKYLQGNREPEEHAIFGRFLIEFRRAASARVMELEEGLKGKEWVKNLATLERLVPDIYSRRREQGGEIESYNPDERFL